MCCDLALALIPGVRHFNLTPLLATKRERGSPRHSGANSRRGGVPGAGLRERRRARGEKDGAALREEEGQGHGREKGPQAKLHDRRPQDGLGRSSALSQLGCNSGQHPS